jgi:hypothetical protein
LILRVKGEKEEEEEEDRVVVLITRSLVHE